MTYQIENEEAMQKKGRIGAIVACWFLGNGSLIAWNSMLTIVDYYLKVFPKYHPTRVLTVVYQPFALTTTAILAYHEAKLNTRIRNLFGYTLFFISTLLVIILDLVTSGKGGIGPFIGVCLISVAFGIADGLVQGGMVGDLALMQPEFIQSFLAGLAASGALTSALRLITKAAFEHSHDGLRKGAMLFFAVASFLVLLCVLLYAFIFPKLPIVRYYRAKAASEGSKTVSADLVALIKFLCIESRKGLMIAILSRFLFIPAFYFTAKKGGQGWMIMLTSLLGLTNGHLTVCVLTTAPKGYKGPEANALGNLLVTFLLGGIFSGVALDWLWLIGKGW